MQKDKWSPILFLALAAAVIAAAALLAARRNAPLQTAYVPMEPVQIAVAADLHYLSPALTDGSAYFTQVITNADGKLMQYSDELAEALVSELLAQKPDVLILPGDLTFNGARESHAGLAEKLRRLTDAGVRVLVLPGNHDLDNPMAARFAGDGFARVESVTAAEFASIYGAFSYDGALNRDSASLSYVSEISPGLRILLIDTNTSDAPGAVRAETLRWAEEALKAAQAEGARVICVTHQTVLQHNSLFLDGFAIENRDALLSLLQRYGVRCSLGGHMHIQHIRTSGSLTEILTSALCVSPCQYGLLDVDADGGTYRTRTLAVPEVADFAQTADDFFTENTLRQGRAATQDEAMLRYLCEMNRCYYAGTSDTLPREDALLSAWEHADPIIGAYLRSVAEDAGKDHTTAEFTF